MKKTALMLALSSVFAAPAMADVTIGGEFDTFLERFDNGADSKVQGNNTHTRWWMDVAEDIGGGTKAKGHFEVDVGVIGYHGGNAVSGNGSGINNRNSFIGLAGDAWGEVRFGTQEGIYEATGYNVDPFHGAAGPGGNIVNGLGQTGFFGAVCNADNIGCRRVDSTLTYISPNFSGFSFQVDYSLQQNAIGSNKKWTELEYGGRYDGNMGGTGFRIYAAGINIKNPDTEDNDGKDSGIRVGAGLTWMDLSVDLLYEQNKWQYNPTNDELKRRNLWIGGSYNLPTGKIVAGYTFLGKAKVNGTTLSDSKATNLAIGYYHTLSKHASAYVIYDRMNNKDNAAFQIQSGGTADFGKDPSTIGVGMYLTF